MKKTLLFVLAVFVLVTTKAQDINDVKQSENKFVYGNQIKLFLGDKIYVEATSDGENLKDFKVVSSISDTSKAIKIEFKYGIMGRPSSILKVNNPYSNILTYKAKIRVREKDNYKETSIEPVFPKIFSMELWPNKLESIILSDFKVTEKKR